MLGLLIIFPFFLSLFNTPLFCLFVVYLTPSSFSCYKACTDSIYQIQTIPSLYYTFRKQTAKNMQVLVHFSLLTRDLRFGHYDGGKPRLHPG